MTVEPLGDAALRVTCAHVPGPAATAQVLALDSALRQAAWPGVLAVVPGYTTLVVHLDPDLADLQTVRAELSELAASVGPDAAAPPRADAARDWQIPVVYDGEDLAAVAAYARLAEADFVALHSGAHYTVACLGFAPGFGYLLGLPPRLHMPRRATPRAAIAAGSVILGGQQTAVMPQAMPSGWHVLGRTDWQLFDPQAPAPSLLQPGDRVRFVPVTTLAVAA